MNSRMDVWYNLKMFFGNMFSLMMYYVCMIMGIMVVGYISVFVMSWFVQLTLNQQFGIIVVY